MGLGASTRASTSRSHPEADEDGFRGDVLELVLELGVIASWRYPGGNFVSGIPLGGRRGAPRQRPARLDLAWRAVETSQFGLNEFITWSRQARVEPLCSRSTSGPGVPRRPPTSSSTPTTLGGTQLSDLRRKHGHDTPPRPTGRGAWGNEMDAPWQLGKMKTATEYGRLAVEAAKTMRLVLPLASSWSRCGSSHAVDAELRQLGSPRSSSTASGARRLHSACTPTTRSSSATCPASSPPAGTWTWFIEEIIATVDHVAARKRAAGGGRCCPSSEWNVWFQQHFPGPESLDVPGAAPRHRGHLRHRRGPGRRTLIISLLRHSDRVRVACQAQLVNVIGAIRSEPGGPAWRQSIYFPLAHAARHARGVALNLAVEAPTYVAELHGEVPLLESIATWDPEDGAVTFFMVNRSLDRPLPVTAELGRRWASAVVHEHLVPAADGDVRRRNTEHAPGAVAPRASRASSVTGNAADDHVGAVVVERGPAGAHRAGREPERWLSTARPAVVRPAVTGPRPWSSCRRSSSSPSSSSSTRSDRRST